MLSCQIGQVRNAVMYLKINLDQEKLMLPFFGGVSASISNLLNNPFKKFIIFLFKDFPDHVVNC